MVLAGLEKKRVLESRTRGKIRLYSIRKHGLAGDYLLIAEAYKKIRFRESNPVISEIIDELYDNIEGIAAIFGSYAKATQKKGSDLDIFVAGECRADKIADISKKYRIQINVKCYPLKAFGRDFLMSEVHENHVLIKNEGDYVRRMLQWIRQNGA